MQDGAVPPAPVSNGGGDRFLKSGHWVSATSTEETLRVVFPPPFAEEQILWCLLGGRGVGGPNGRVPRCATCVALGTTGLGTTVAWPSQQAGSSRLEQFSTGSHEDHHQRLSWLHCCFAFCFVIVCMVTHCAAIAVACFGLDNENSHLPGYRPVAVWQWEALGKGNATSHHIQ